MLTESLKRLPRYTNQCILTGNSKTFRLPSNFAPMANHVKVPEWQRAVSNYELSFRLKTITATQTSPLQQKPSLKSP